MDAFITRRGGGGAPLNFKITGGTTAPENPKENTIWVNTDTEMTGWTFSATEPESPIEGMVWIKTNNISQNSFDALTKNGLTVYPECAVQYISGSWDAKEGRIYQAGNWIELWGGYLYRNGNMYEYITGGWTVYNSSAGTGAIFDDNIRISYSGSSGRDSSVYTNQKIDFSKHAFNTLYARVNITYVGLSGVTLGVTQAAPSASVYYNNCAVKTSSKITGSQVLSVDVSSIRTGEYYIALGADASDAYIYEVWME